MDNPDQGCLARLRETEVQPGFVAQLQATLTLGPPHRCLPEQAANKADNSRATKGGQMTRYGHRHAAPLSPG